MPWSTPLTAVANAALTASQWNASVRDNLLATAVAKATTPGSIFVATGVNSIEERRIVQTAVESSESTTSTTYADLATAGPTLTVTTGTRALVWLNVHLTNTGTSSTFVSYRVDGATTVEPSDNFSVAYDPPYAGGSLRAGICDLRVLTAGVNTFKLQYRVNSNSGSFFRRRLQIMGL